jgi:hypothetical protein
MSMFEDFLGSISQTLKDHHLMNKLLLPPPQPSYGFNSFPQDELIILQSRYLPCQALQDSILLINHVCVPSHCYTRVRASHSSNKRAL